MCLASRGYDVRDKNSIWPSVTFAEPNTENEDAQTSSVGDGNANTHHLQRTDPEAIVALIAIHFASDRCEGKM